MPATPLKNTLYRLGLIIAAPSVSTQLTLERFRGDEALLLSPDYGPGRIVKRNHVLGGTLLLGQGDTQTYFCASTRTAPKHTAQPDTMYRVASITKTATALCLLRLEEKGLLRLSDTLFSHLPCTLAPDAPLRRATVEQVLCHTSGLRDTPAYEATFARRGGYDEVLHSEGVIVSEPGACFAYCNFGFGLLGSLIEQLTGESVESVFQREVFAPLDIRATLDVTQVPEGASMPISRVLPYRASRAYKAEEAAKKTLPLSAPDPATHYGYTAGSMFTDAASLDRLLRMLASGGMSYLSKASIARMTAVQARYGDVSPTLAYGLGLLIIEDKRLSDSRIIGHQGFAYGCADGAFYEEATGRRMIMLNSGASEARVGRLGQLNHDLLAWAFRKENDAWR